MAVIDNPTTLQLTPQSPTIGALVDGIDLRAPLTDEQLRQTYEGSFRTFRHDWGWIACPALGRDLFAH